MPNPIKMKILVCLDVPHLEEAGGAEVHAYRMGKALAAKGCDIKIIVPSPGAWVLKERSIRGVRTIYLPVPIVKWPKLFWFLYSCELLVLILIHHDWPIIHLQGQKAFTSALLGKLLAHKTVTFKLLSKNYWQIFFESKKHSFISRMLLKKIDCFISPSIDLKNYVLTNGILSKKIHYIPNGVPLTIVNHNKTSRKSLHIPDDKTIVTYAGVLYPRKNIPILIEAWARAIKQTEKGFLFILGDGPQRRPIEDLIIKYNLQNHVCLRGYVSNVDEYLKESDIFILPSYVEGCSNALLEAMSNGCACIASHYPWNAEIIKHDINGLLFEPNNIPMLVDCILRLGNNPRLCQALGQKALETIKEKFSLEDTMNMYYNLFNGCKK